VTATEIRIRGRVQGVGFRPTVWRLASELGLDGEVLNDGDGVLIRLQGSADQVEAMLTRLAHEPPPLARIDRVEQQPFYGAVTPGFRIAKSGGGPPHTEISPDAALCALCAEEVLSAGGRRHRYAFTNCTHCGPRLSIVRAIPYDRGTTTMAAFPLCRDCERQYRDPADRRFHAEPIACPVCGPQLKLVRLDSGERTSGDPIDAAARLLADGEILAIKGLGGHQLACDATNPEAVTRLRRLKQRDAKPFALMARDLGVIRRYCTLTREAEQALTGAAASIVLLPADGPEGLPETVAPGLRTLGFMLPTTPLHLLLLQELDRPLVMTSGNLSDEPQAIDDDDAAARLGCIAGHALMHNREIANRVDDSVVRVIDGRPRLLRRARGYAPAPIALPPGFEEAPQILAMGGELKATFCLVKDGKAILSQHQGDLEHPAAFDDYCKNLALFRDLFAHTPVALAADRHPEYLSAKLARERARSEGVPLIEVQHHHAHLAACLAENGRPGDAPPVLGIVLDGLGWGDDGTIWGGEFLWGDYFECERMACLAPVAMPGGAQAVREPWRNLYAQLIRGMDWPELARRFGHLALYAWLTAKPLAVLDKMIASGINTPLSSSCGRLFDAVAAALNIRPGRQAYEGEAAMRLEAIVDETTLQFDSGYRFDVVNEATKMSFMPGIGPSIRERPERPRVALADGRAKPGREREFEAPMVLDPRPIWDPLLRDLAIAVPRPVIAARFHKGLARGIAEVAEKLTEYRPFDTIALSGGCFQNAILFGEVSRRLRAEGFVVLSHAEVPANDGGLALGQAAIAAARLIQGGV
jgi:hydrogenase maturation protein HypF